MIGISSVPRMLGVGVLGVVVSASPMWPGDAFAQINMPDPSLIAGKAIPSSDLPNGAVTVRVVREAIGNNVTGQEVRLTAAGATRTAKTDEQGRAEFRDLPAGAEARAEATVNGERLISDPFSAPAAGGLRVILVAGLANAAERRKQEAAAAAAAPPVRGAVVFGGDTRIVMEFQEDTLRVFYSLDIQNSARARVDLGGPLILDLPPGAGGASVLEGSSPSATVSGDRVTILGPFAPGSTTATVGFELRYDDPDVTVSQTWPAAVEQVTVAIEKVGALSLTSSQFSRTGEVSTEDGTPYVLATGAGIPAGGTLTFELSHLPVHSETPKLVALSLAAALLLVGAWLAFARKIPVEAARRLAERRDALLAELVDLDKRGSAGTGNAAQDARRRQRLVSELERVLADIDEADVGPQGGGEGVAA